MRDRTDSECFTASRPSGVTVNNRFGRLTSRRRDRALGRGKQALVFEAIERDVDRSPRHVPSGPAFNLALDHRAVRLAPLLRQVEDGQHQHDLELPESGSLRHDAYNVSNIGEASTENLRGSGCSSRIVARVRLVSRVCSSHMTWLTWLLLAALIAVVAAVTGIKPKGTRHVANTRMMGAARIVLILIAIIVAYAIYRSQ